MESMLAVHKIVHCPVCGSDECIVRATDWTFEFCLVCEKKKIGLLGAVIVEFVNSDKTIGHTDFPVYDWMNLDINKYVETVKSHYKNKFKTVVFTDQVLPPTIFKY